MAFKRMDMSPEGRARRAAEMEEAMRRRQDHEAFGNAPSSTHGVQIVDHPIIEPMGGLTSIKARDEEGVVTLLLKGDRSPETVFEPRTEALNRALSGMQVNAMTIRAGVPAQVEGVAGRVDWAGKRQEGGKFRAIFVETLDFSIDGQHYSYGRAREAERVAPEAPSKAAGENVVDLAAVRGGKQASEKPEVGKGVEDVALFGGRRLRQMDLTVSGLSHTTPEGAAVFDAHNARGPVSLVFAGSRGAEWDKGPAGQALVQALKEGPVEMAAEGFFKSRQVPVAGGKTGQAWDFTAATATFQDKSGVHVVGRVPDHEALTQAAQKTAPASRRSRDRDEAR